MGATEVFVAIITGVFGLLASFFGISYWTIFKGMVKQLQEQVTILEQRNMALQDRLDRIERDYQEKIDQLEVKYNQEREQVVLLMGRVDDQAAAAQFAKLQYDKLAIDSEKITGEHEAMIERYVQEISDLKDTNKRLEDLVMIIISNLADKLQVTLDDIEMDGDLENVNAEPA